MTEANIASQADPSAAMRPRSAVSTGVGLAGLAGLIGWLLIARHYGMNGPNAALTSVVACGLPMVLWSVLVDKVHRNPTTGIDWDRQPRSLADIRDISATKLAGLWCTWAVLAFVYAILRYYWQGNYLFAITLFAWLAVPLVLLSIPYVLWLDRRLEEPKDNCWAFGHWLLGRDGPHNMDAIWSHWRTWAVKGFFTAFMVSIVPPNFVAVVDTPMKQLLASPVEAAAFGIAFLYMVDVHLATVGYVMTMRPLDAHIREANPYGMAWVAALICYPPFILMGAGGPLSYEVGTAPWHQWMAGHAWLLWIWAGLLVALTAVYAWATVAFGLRFSNLTHRGIITHGPYAFPRHPAYVAKNLFWWLSVLPFLPASGSIMDAVRNTVLLGLVSGVYYWRAKTEEQHLLADPDYRRYWQWAQDHAMIPRLFKHFNGQEMPLVTLQPKRSAIGKP